MSIHLICLTTNGGLPILTKKKGKCDNLPFSTVASLNGFHMFFKSLGITLHTTYAHNWTYLWRDFNNSITIIVSFCGLGEYIAELLTEIVFGAISLFVSRDELLHPGLLERLKKESKHYLPIVDAALEACLVQFLGFSNCIFATENVQILQRLNDIITVQCASLFCCLVIEKRIVVATDGWWDLHIVDRQLLLLILQASNNLQNDIAVYLPKKSPNVAYRFVTVPVSINSVLCVICGTEPSIKVLYDIAKNTFRSDWHPLQSIERLVPKCLPVHLEMDSSIEAFILINMISRKSVFSINSHNVIVKHFFNDVQAYDHLRRFFDQFQSNVEFLKSYSTTRTLLDICDQYWITDSNKYYLQTDSNHNVFCILCILSIPTYTMRRIGSRIFAQIKQEKSFCW